MSSTPRTHKNQHQVKTNMHIGSGHVGTQRQDEYVNNVNNNNNNLSCGSYDNQKNDKNLFRTFCKSRSLNYHHYQQQQQDQYRQQYQQDISLTPRTGAIAISDNRGISPFAAYADKNDSVDDGKDVTASIVLPTTMKSTMATTGMGKYFSKFMRTCSCTRTTSLRDVHLQDMYKIKHTASLCNNLTPRSSQTTDISSQYYSSSHNNNNNGSRDSSLTTKGIKTKAFCKRTQSTDKNNDNISSISSNVSDLLAPCMSAPVNMLIVPSLNVHHLKQHQQQQQIEKERLVEKAETITPRRNGIFGIINNNGNSKNQQQCQGAYLESMDRSVKSDVSAEMTMTDNSSLSPHPFRMTDTGREISAELQQQHQKKQKKKKILKLPRCKLSFNRRRGSVYGNSAADTDCKRQHAVSHQQNTSATNLGMANTCSGGMATAGLHSRRQQAIVQLIEKRLAEDNASDNHHYHHGSSNNNSNNSRRVERPHNKAEQMLRENTTVMFERSRTINVSRARKARRGPKKGMIHHKRSGTM